MKKIFISFAILLMAFSSLVKAMEEDGALALRKSKPIQLYMGACVITRAQPELVEKQAKELGFKRASKSAEINYLQNQSGRAWSLERGGEHYGLALLDNSLCTLFIHQGDPKKLKASMESWLPPEGSGFSYKSEVVSESEGLKTTAYTLYRSGTLWEQWVITITKQPNPMLAAIMSYDAP